MKNVIYDDRESESWSWIKVTKGRKYITLYYTTCVQGDRDITITYPLEAEENLLNALSGGNGYPKHNINDLADKMAFAPKYIKIRKSEPIR